MCSCILLYGEGLLPLPVNRLNLKPLGWNITLPSSLSYCFFLWSSVCVCVCVNKQINTHSDLTGKASEGSAGFLAQSGWWWEAACCVCARVSAHACVKARVWMWFSHLHLHLIYWGYSSRSQVSPSLSSISPLTLLSSLCVFFSLLFWSLLFWSVRLSQPHLLCRHLSLFFFLTHTHYQGQKRSFFVAITNIKR